MSPYLAKAIASVPLDFELSPLTGWTRDHHAAVTSAALVALRPYASVGRSRFYLPGPASASGAVSDSLEAFARSFVGASFLLGGGADDPHGFADWYAQGLTSGVDPSSYDAWPRLVHLPQARVEAAQVAMGLHHTRSTIWDQLSASTQEQVVAWLSESHRVIYPRSNWVLFFAVTQAFLRSIGAPTDEDRVENCLRIMEDCYLGDGWYSDGPFGPGELPRGPQVDWYQSFVIHHFFAQYAAMTPALDLGRRELWRERLQAWATRAIALFGADGAPLFQGRSLTYRFGVLAGLLDAGCAGVGPRPGQIRRVASGTLGYFHRVRAFDAEGLLSVGWHGPHDRVRQAYSGSGSPYWAMHAMTGLVVAADHPLWSAVEEPSPVEQGQVRIPLKGCSWLITSDDHGIVRVSNHGVDHVQARVPGPDPLYDRLAYSTATAPIEGRLDGDTAVGDNRVVLRRGPRTWHRRLMLESRVDLTCARSRWLLDDGPDAPVVRCLAIPRGPIEVRLVRVDSVAPSDQDLPLTLIASGWPASHGLTARIHGLLGTWREGFELFADQPMAGEVQVAHLVTETSPGPWLAVAVSLTRSANEPNWPTVALALDPAQDAPAGHQIAEVTWSDGHTDRLDLPRWP